MPDVPPTIEFKKLKTADGMPAVTFGLCLPAPCRASGFVCVGVSADASPATRSASGLSRMRTGEPITPLEPFSLPPAAPSTLITLSSTPSPRSAMAPQSCGGTWSAARPAARCLRVPVTARAVTTLLYDTHYTWHTTDLCHGLAAANCRQRCPAARSCAAVDVSRCWIYSYLRHGGALCAFPPLRHPTTVARGVAQTSNSAKREVHWLLAVWVCVRCVWHGAPAL